MAVAAKTAAAGRIHRSTDEFARTGRSNLQAMSPASTNPAAERELLEGARQGDENAFQRLVEPHRTELHAHCYRMLGSYADAEDALQETLLRAWRGLPRFEGRSSLRTWLYRIATNTCLRVIERRPKRVLPIDYTPSADPHDGPGDPVSAQARGRTAAEPNPATSASTPRRQRAQRTRRALRRRLGAKRRRRPRLHARGGRQDDDAAAAKLVQRPRPGRRLPAWICARRY